MTAKPQSTPGGQGPEPRLSDEFYDSLLSAPVPMNLETLHALGGSASRLDTYLQATHSGSRS
jgi:hypothetical protein